ncbi:MAG: hypothetical protein NT029_08255 [Armatimonadetes bacterium]|nr:hypothetical protein [Armatimonadota bacterium]
MAALLADAGLWDGTAPTGVDADGYVAAARGEFEARTGRLPFLGTAQTRTFDPPGPNTSGKRWFGFSRGGGRILNLGTGLLSVTTLTSGKTGLSNGTVLTANTDFVLRPYDAPAEGQPYRSIEFLAPQWGSAATIEIVGVWGWSATIPDDVWAGVLAGAATRAGRVLASQASMGVQKVSIGGDSFDFGASPFGAQIEAWADEFDALVRRYMRMDG